jgi:hypothetical protein
MQQCDRASESSLRLRRARDREVDAPERMIGVKRRFGRLRGLWSLVLWTLVLWSLVLWLLVL